MKQILFLLVRYITIAWMIKTDAVSGVHNDISLELPTYRAFSYNICNTSPEKFLRDLHCLSRLFSVEKKWSFKSKAVWKRRIGIINLSNTRCLHSRSLSNDVEANFCMVCFERLDIADQILYELCKWCHGSIPSVMYRLLYPWQVGKLQSFTCFRTD